MADAGVAGEAAPGHLAGGSASRDLARYYDLDLSADPGDLELYVALARRTQGPVLELAVGTGRIAVPLAAAGWEVTGVDHDPEMLARALERWYRAGAGALEGSRRDRDGAGALERSPHDREGAGALELVRADLTQVDLGRRFALVVLALNSLLLLATPDRQAAALGTMARHLRPGGLGVVDVWLPGADDLALYDGRLLLEWIRDDLETGERVAKLASAVYDPAMTTVDLQAIFDAWPPGGGPVRRVARADRLRLVTADELVRRAEDAGLAVDLLAADYALTQFGPGADRAVLVATLV